MKIIRCIFALTAAAIFCHAADNEPAGKVVNRAGTAIAGATVKLLPSGRTTITGIDGRFTFSPTVTWNSRRNSGISAQSVITPMVIGGDLRVNCMQQSTVEIAAYTTRGQLVEVVKRKVDAGSNSIPLPCHRAGVL